MDGWEILHERYAKALFLASEHAKCSEDVLEELEWLVALLKNEQLQLHSVFSSLIIGRREKEDVLESICAKARFPEVMKSFLCVLARGNRLNIIHGVFLRYRDIFDQSRRRLKVFVTAAEELKPSQKEKLAQALSMRLKKEVDVAVKVEPALLGGLKIQVGDELMDFSVKNNLEAIMAG